MDLPRLQATVYIAPQAFTMGVAIAASNSFLFPIGHQASVLVGNPGGCRFFDYTKVGLPLTLLIWLFFDYFLANSMVTLRDLGGPKSGTDISSSEDCPALEAQLELLYKAPQSVMG